MQELVSIFLIGVSLSMDTFSLSLSMGTLIKNKKFLTLFPFVVALFHFIMPLIGNKIGITIMNCFNIASNIVLGLILIILGVNLAIQFFKKELDALCASFGMTTTTAINVFAKAVVRERRIPFEIKAPENVSTQEKALKAFLQLRENAKRDFDEEMTLDEINEEIQKVRYKEAI